jgi:nanoRNase/pAp phosphatase (c-di-AMP/oligoRNAs hydrolase)
MDMLKWAAQPDGNVIVTYIMTEETIVCGNRFVVFAMYPEQNVEVRVLWGENREKVIFAVGHSIINRSCATDIGKLMLEYGGGGHSQVGSCRVDANGWRDSLAEIVGRLQES